MNHQTLRKYLLRTLTICFWLLKSDWGWGRCRENIFQLSTFLASWIVNDEIDRQFDRSTVETKAGSFSIAQQVFCFFENCLSWSAERVEKHVINTMFDVRPSVSMKPLKQHRGIVRRIALNNTESLLSIEIIVSTEPSKASTQKICTRLNYQN